MRSQQAAVWLRCRCFPPRLAAALRITVDSAFNLAFRDWHTIFPNASCAVGLIDRLTHHAAIVKVTGDSYRLREAEQAQKSRLAS